MLGLKTIRDLCKIPVPPTAKNLCLGFGCRGGEGLFCKGLGLCGLLEEGAHGKSPKCLGGNLGDFGEFCKGLGPSETFSDGLFLFYVLTIKLRSFFDELNRFFFHALPLGFLLVGVVAYFLRDFH